MATGCPPASLLSNLQAMDVSKNELFVGVSPPRLAARGLIESVMIFELGVDVYRTRSIGLSPFANYFAVTPNGENIVALSTQERTLRKYSAVSGRVLGTYEKQGRSPCVSRLRAEKWHNPPLTQPDLRLMNL